jgi:hypothetical protein
MRHILGGEQRLDGDRRCLIAASSASTAIGGVS